MKNKYNTYQQHLKALLLKGKFFAARSLKRYLAWEHSWKTTSVGLTVAFVGFFLGFSIISSSAATTVLVPNADVTTGWTVLGGTSDSTCAGGTHCDYVDENTTDNTADYIGTGTAGTTGETEEYDMTTQANIATATQIQLRVYAQSATNANGGTLDSISVNARINGTLQTATTCSPAFNTWAACTATFNGTWNQSDIDSLRAQIVRNRLGSGGPSGQDDDVRISNVYVTLTYTASINYEQSSYRWLNNADSATPATFVKTNGSTANDRTISHVQTSDGGYIAGGTTFSYGAGSSDAFLAKYDSSGTLSWSRTWGGTSSDNGAAVFQTSDGGYALSGSTGSFVSGGGASDLFLAKYDSSGTLSWSRTWGTADDDYVNSMIQTADAGYVLTGESYNFGIDEEHLLLIKYDSSGTLSWAKSMGGSTDQSAGYSVIQTADSGYAVAGSSNAGGDALFAKFDSSGTLSWARTWGGGGLDEATAVAQNADGSYALTGQTNSHGAGAGDAFLAKYDSSGTLSWSRTWGGASNEYAHDIKVTTDGGVILTGFSMSYGAGAGDAFLAKYDSSGTLSWSRTWGGASGLDEGQSVVQTADGGYSLSGLTNSFGAGSTDMFLAKYDSSGNVSGCSSPMCQTPTPGTSSPSATSSTYSPTISTASGTSNTPSPGTSSPTMGGTSQVALSPTTIDVGTSLAAQDTAATAPAEGTPFRLRMNIHISNAQLDASAAQLKLRYALKGGAASCSVVSSGSYADVTDSTTIQYYDNTNAVNGLGLATNANDPTHSSDTIVRQSYLEKGASVFSNANALPVGQDGMWDFALVGYHTIQNDRYCFKVTHNDGSNLNTYTSYPELIIPTASIGQAAYRWYNPEPAGGEVTFAKAYGTSDAQTGTEIVNTSDGGYATTHTASVGGISFAYLSKYDSTGTLEWIQEISTQGGDLFPLDIIQNSSDGFVITGEYNNPTGGADVFTAGFDSVGDLQWSHTWGAASRDVGYGVVELTGGDYVVAATINSYGSGQSDAGFLRYQSNGTFIDDQTYGGTLSDGNPEITATSDGGYAMTGQTSSYTSGLADAFLAKFTSTGTLSWSRSWGGATSDSGHDIIQTSDGGYAIAGASQSYSTNGSYDSFLAKFNSSGTLSWSRTWGDTGDDRTYGLTATSDDGFAVTGYTTSVGAGGNDIFISKYDSSGTRSWTKTWGTTGTEFAFGIVQASDGGYAVSGSTNSYGQGSTEALLLKYDSSGDIVGCTAPMCQSPTATSASPSASILSPTVPTTSPSATQSALTLDIVGTTYTTTTILAHAADVGNPLAPLNSPLDLSTLTPLNLRVAVAVNNSGINASGVTLKLQYSLLGDYSSCSVVPSGSYADITTGTTIAYYDDASVVSGAPILDNPNDPSDGSRTMMAQTYQEANNFTNSQSAIYAGQDGMWQFSLTINNSSIKGKDFCVRTYSVTDSSLLSATQIPEVAYAPQMKQMLGKGKWFNRQGVRQPYSL